MQGLILGAMKAFRSSRPSLDDELATFLAAAGRRGWTLVRRPATEPVSVELTKSVEPQAGLRDLGHLVRAAVASRWTLVRLIVRHRQVGTLAIQVRFEPSHALRMARVTASVARTKRSAHEPLGRPPEMAKDVFSRIVMERASGRLYREIADGLELDGIPAPRGGHKWHASTIRAAYMRSERPRSG